MTERTIDYGPYALICTAAPAAGGGFSARLVVSLGHDTASEQTPVPLPHAVFGSEDEAIEHAAAQGRDWVDNNG